VIIRALFALGLTIGGSTALLAAEPERVSRRDFLEERSGKLAVFLNANSMSSAQNTIKLNFFPQNGEYEIPRSTSTLWFSVNHIVRSDVADDSDGDYDPTYLGVQILSYAKGPYSPSSKVYLFRNGNWVGFDGSSLKKPFSRAYANRSFSDFATLQSETNDETASRELLKRFSEVFGEWHGKVTPDSQSSWEFRGNWAGRDVTSAGVGPAAIKNYLIRFTPNSSGYSTKYLLFNTNVANYEKIRIRTFAPTFSGSPDLFDNDVTITFK